MLPHWTEQDLQVNGAFIHYYRTGDGSKPPLVLAHGFSDGGLCWLPVARDLESEYDVILPDARGHGQSQQVQPGETLDMVADLAGLIQGLGLNRPVVGGHSMGGSVSGQLGARYPELARALILEDPAWWLPRPADAQPEEEPEEPKENPYHVWLKSLDDQSIEAIMAKCRADSPTWDEVELQPWALTKKQFDVNFFQARGTGLSAVEVIEKICVPTLLLTAETERGAIVTPEMTEYAPQHNALIQPVFIAGAGHNIRRENYADFMAAVRGFLKALP